MDQKVICHGFIGSRGLTNIEGRIPDTTNVVPCVSKNQQAENYTVH